MFCNFPRINSSISTMKNNWPLIEWYIIRKQIIQHPWYLLQLQKKSTNVVYAWKHLANTVAGGNIKNATPVNAPTNATFVKSPLHNKPICIGTCSFIRVRNHIRAKFAINAFHRQQILWNIKLFTPMKNRSNANCVQNNSPNALISKNMKWSIQASIYQFYNVFFLLKMWIDL